MLTFACYAQEPEYRVKSYPNGGIMYDGYFIEGKPTEITRYYESGRIQSYQKFSKDGSSTIELYNSDATPFAKGGYDSNKRRHGTWIFYGENGVMVMKATYKAGLKDGLMLLYFNSGVVMDKVYYKDDKIDGERTQFYQTGEKLAIMNYTAGILNGYYVSYFDNGDRDCEGYYKDGLRDGEWKFYNADGSIDEYKFRNGKCRKYEDMLKRENRESEIDRHIPDPSIEDL